MQRVKPDYGVELCTFNRQMHSFQLINSQQLSGGVCGYHNDITKLCQQPGDQWHLDGCHATADSQQDMWPPAANLGCLSISQLGLMRAREAMTNPSFSMKSDHAVPCSQERAWHGDIADPALLPVGKLLSWSSSSDCNAAAGLWRTAGSQCAQWCLAHLLRAAAQQHDSERPAPRSHHSAKKSSRVLLFLC